MLVDLGPDLVLTGAALYPEDFNAYLVIGAMAGSPFFPARSKWARGC
jgi:hypothetical protein